MQKKKKAKLDDDDGGGYITYIKLKRKRNPLLS